MCSTSFNGALELIRKVVLGIMKKKSFFRTSYKIKLMFSA